MKKSFGNCNICPLEKQSMVIGETNCEKDLGKVEVLLLAEAPAIEEAKIGRPLVGKAGKLFRLVFEDLGLNKFPYYITNCCLCTNINNGKTETPPPEALECCKNNLHELLKVIKPKIILAMGSIPMNILGISESHITSYRGKIYKYNNIDVLLTFHPSYISRCGGLNTPNGELFKSDLKNLYNILSGNNPVFKIQEQGIKTETLNEIYSYKLPDKYYSDELMLLDIQHIMEYEKNELIYIFKNKNGSKEYLNIIVNEHPHYFFKDTTLANSPTLKNFKELQFSKEKIAYDGNFATYEKDVSDELKHSIDYRYNRNKIGINEPYIPLKIQYMDIEVYTGNDKSFPDPKLAKHPINSISFLYNDDSNKIFVYLLQLPEMDKAEIKIENTEIEVKVFKRERDLLSAYFENTKKSNCDIIAAWNGSNFDYTYIFNRCKNIGISINDWSPLNLYKFDERWSNGHQNYGLIMVDLLDQYKKFTPSVKESYKLGYISEVELGEGKVAYEGTLNENYEKNINKFIEYSAVDSKLLFELDNKVKNIELIFEIIKICSSVWSRSSNTMGLIDPLIISKAKEKDLVCRDSLKGLSNNKREFAGAFVNQPQKGIHKYVVDLDFTSLYPSIIMSYNMDVMTYVAKIDSAIMKEYLYGDKSKITENFDIKYLPWKQDSKESSITLDEFEKIIEDNNLLLCITGTMFKSHDIEISLTSHIINYILESRIFYKEERNKFEPNSVDYTICDMKQWAFKILANSIYGVLANEYFRFYNIDLAESITLTGQEVNQFSQYHAGFYLKDGNEIINKDFQKYIENNGNPPYIIAGDTDSLFLDLGQYMKDKELIVI